MPVAVNYEYEMPISGQGLFFTRQMATNQRLNINDLPHSIKPEIGRSGMPSSGQ
jgi:hypothetical protein